MRFDDESTRSPDGYVAYFSAQGAMPAAIQQCAKARNQEVPAYDQPAPATGAVPARLCLEVHFFDRFEVLCEGKAVNLCYSNTKGLAILRYLLAHPSRPISQDYLMGWLWPESDLKRARWSLNSTIRALRKALRYSRSPISSVDYILFEDGYYCLSPTVQVWTDTEAFDAFYERARLLEKAQRMPEAAAEYARAVELYRGEYLSEDLYEDWTMIERERLANTYVDMLHRLATYYAKTDQYHKSIQACYQLLKSDPSHEDSYRLLVHCYVQLGMRTRALRQYQLCKQVLKRKFNVHPSSETEALYQSILRGDSPH
jgi:DNA-binding SARP family transcriptional activator